MSQIYTGKIVYLGNTSLIKKIYFEVFFYKISMKVQNEQCLLNGSKGMVQHKQNNGNH